MAHAPDCNPGHVGSIPATTSNGPFERLVTQVTRSGETKRIRQRPPNMLADPAGRRDLSDKQVGASPCRVRLPGLAPT